MFLSARIPREHMMHKFVGLATTVAVFGTLSGGDVAAAPIFGSTFSDSHALIKIADEPPRASKTGRANRSATARSKGANQRKFCPPGQRKKPGKGSAFNC
jgi:hypothetical protein